jgi:hypothetical protein
MATAISLTASLGSKKNRAAVALAVGQVMLQADDGRVFYVDGRNRAAMLLPVRLVGIESTGV